MYANINKQSHRKEKTCSLTPVAQAEIVADLSLKTELNAHQFTQTNQSAGDQWITHQESF